MTTRNLKNSISRSPLPVGVQRVQRIWIIRGSLLIALGCFALSLAPNAFGVNPPPDGGYPGGNTAEGQNALLGLTSGGYNTAVGFFSLRSETAGSFNTAIGAGTLFENVGDPSTGSGEENTATGAAALLSNTIGSFNTANGAFALFRNSVGVQNTAIGSHALFRNIGNGNTATGESALLNNTTGFDNTAIGSAALLFNTTGASNIALGLAAGSGVSTANDVICIGTGGADVSYSCFIGNIRGTTTGQMDAVPVV